MKNIIESYFKLLNKKKLILKKTFFFIVDKTVDEVTDNNEGKTFSYKNSKNKTIYWDFICAPLCH